MKWLLVGERVNTSENGPRILFIAQKGELVARSRQLITLSKGVKVEPASQRTPSELGALIYRTGESRTRQLEGLVVQKSLEQKLAFGLHELTTDTQLHVPLLYRYFAEWLGVTCNSVGLQMEFFNLNGIIERSKAVKQGVTVVDRKALAKIRQYPGNL